MTRQQPEPLSRREWTKEVRRRNIVHAARELIKRTGEPGFTMQELAEAAGVSLMTPYNLFGSKQRVMVAVLDEDLRLFSDRLARVRADELDILFRTISIARRLYAGDESFYRSIFGSIQGTHREQRAPFIEPRRQLWIKLVQDAMDAGFLDARADAPLVAANVGDLFYACVQQWLFDGAPLSKFALRARYAMALTLLGIATPAGRPRLQALMESASRQLMKTSMKTGAGDEPSPAAATTAIMPRMAGGKT